MESPEDRKELEMLLSITINQIPSYVNMVNSEDWDVSSEDCIFGMVYHSFIAKSTEYMKNKFVDTGKATDAESTFEMMNSISEIFNGRIADVRQAIVSTSNS